MKQGMFPGTLIAGLGVYFLARQWSVPFIGEIGALPAFLLIIGIAFLLQKNEPYALFSGVVICGIAVHYYASGNIANWPSLWIVYFLSIGVGFILQYNKTKQGGLWIGAALIIVSLIALFSTNTIGIINTIVNYTEQFWAVILIVIGFYLMRRKK
ncbi:hypothetical protein ACTWQL_11755 [Pseudalkalibacillus sp. R45]|uniref:hypothetical protein n=1 Tax=Pseudalkalibacillus sp. R45 TaxID=3457433 RepID=UPI003FCEE004